MMKIIWSGGSARFMIGNLLFITKKKVKIDQYAYDSYYIIQYQYYTLIQNLHIDEKTQILPNRNFKI